MGAETAAEGAEAGAGVDFAGGFFFAAASLASRCSLTWRKSANLFSMSRLLSTDGRHDSTLGFASGLSFGIQPALWSPRRPGVPLSPALRGTGAGVGGDFLGSGAFVFPSGNQPDFASERIMRFDIALAGRGRGDSVRSLTDSTSAQRGTTGMAARLWWWCGGGCRVLRDRGATRRGCDRARDATAMEVQSARRMCREVVAMVKNMGREWWVRW